VRTIRIGVTGKLGSGKSVLLRMMAEHGFRVIRTDELARMLMERDSRLRSALTDILGLQTYSEGKLDRAFVASRIFRDKSLLAQVEAAVHPAVTREIEKIFREQPSEVGASPSMLAVESALILKTRFQEIFDYIVLVESPREASIERVVREGRLTRPEAEARLSEQDYGPEAHAEADFIIENADSKEIFEEKCRNLIVLLETMMNRQLPDMPLHAPAHDASDLEESASE
jgi:dephospho-CoA kinase